MVSRSATRWPAGRTRWRRLRRVGQRGADSSSHRPSTASSASSSASSGVSAIRATALGSSSGSARSRPSSSSAAEVRGRVCHGQVAGEVTARRGTPRRGEDVLGRLCLGGRPAGVRVDREHRVAEDRLEDGVEDRQVVLVVDQGEPGQPVERVHLRRRRDVERLRERRHRPQGDRHAGGAQPMAEGSHQGRAVDAGQHRGRRPSGGVHGVSRTRRSRARRAPGPGRRESWRAPRAPAPPAPGPARSRPARRAPRPS